MSGVLTLHSRLFEILKCQTKQRDVFMLDSRLNKRWRIQCVARVVSRGCFFSDLSRCFIVFVVRCFGAAQYVAQFHNEAEEPVCEKPIVIPINDDKKYDC